MLKLSELNTDLPYAPTYAQDDPLVRVLSMGHCFRCANGPLHTMCGFPGNSVHYNGAWILKSNIPHVCEKHEQLLAGEEFPDPKVWFQVSRRHRIVARLPEGMNGNEALLWAMKEYRQKCEDGRRLPISVHERSWAENLSERAAADQFLRVYTCYRFSEHLQLHLTQSQFNAYRKHGGGPV